MYSQAVECQVLCKVLSTPKFDNSSNWNPILRGNYPCHEFKDTFA